MSGVKICIDRARRAVTLTSQYAAAKGQRHSGQNYDYDHVTIWLGVCVSPVCGHSPALGSPPWVTPLPLGQRPDVVQTRVVKFEPVPICFSLQPH